MNYQKIVMFLAVASIAIASVALTFSSSQMHHDPSTGYIPQSREIILLTDVDEDINEDTTGIPPDLYSHEQIIVNKGDNVKIKFYNLEPVETQEHHTFTIESQPYAMDHDINAGENVTIEFDATESGVFDYVCTLHQPTMRGQLVVLDS